MENEDTHEDELGAAMKELGAGGQGFVTRQRVARVADKLFGPLSIEAKAVEIGRFTVLHELGAGGMGVVYVAYDEQLDRRVAIKVLREGSASSEARARFEREAQAMARLSHPNVVGVHEVGTFEGQLFVAMELIEGLDLRRWIAAEQPSWRELLERMLAAGEGLAAAHEAGIVHRDFKPDNVLVGFDGRVCVADFGLANALEPARQREGPSGSESSDTAPVGVESKPEAGDHGTGKRLSESLTRTGSVMGTPAYMAPEQFRGLATDARTDQFSFCVALWEGVYGERPFSGPNLVVLSAAVASGELPEPDPARGVPAWIHAAIVRGLSPRPEDRWPSMRALLDVLGDNPEYRRRRRLTRLAVGLAVSALLGASSWLTLTLLRQGERERYWTGLTESLLTIERERSLAQARDDAVQASDATRMSVMRDYKAQVGLDKPEDPTIAAALLREVKGDALAGSAWSSAANEVLGEGLSRFVWGEHREALGPLAFEPRGRWLYSAADDGEVWRWDLRSGRGELLLRHAQPVTALALDPSGRYLASAGGDGVVQLWSRDQGRRMGATRHGAGVKALAFDPSGALLASGDDDGLVKIVHLPSASIPVAPVSGPELHVGTMIRALAFDPGGEQLFIAGRNPRIVLWQLGDSAPRAVFQGHTMPVFHVEVLDERRMLSAADDGQVRLWPVPELDPGAPELRIEDSIVVAELPGPIGALDVDGERFVAGSTTGELALGSLTPPHEQVSLPAHAGAVFSAHFSPTGAAVVSASLDGSAQRVPLDGAPVERFLGHREGVYSAALDPEGRWLATGSYDTTIRLWDLERPRLSLPIEGHEDTVTSLAVAPGGDRFASGSNDESVRVWSSVGAPLAELSTRGPVTRVLFDPSGERLAVATTRSLELWAVDDDTVLDLRGHERLVWQIAFAPSGQRLASASYDGSARIWDVATGAELLDLRGHEGKVIGVAFDSSGERLVSAGSEGSVRIWDARTGDSLAVRRGSESGLSCLARSPGGEWFAAGAEDGSIWLWRGSEYEERRLLRGPERAIWSLRFDAEGRRLVSSSSDGRARVWGVARGELLAELQGHAGRIWDARFDAGGRVITTGADQTLRVWSIEEQVLPLVLSGHGAQHPSLALLPGDVLLSGASDGSVRRWRLDLLTNSPATLAERLAKATDYCLSVEQRVTELGEDPQLARAQVEACARERGTHSSHMPL